MRRIKQKPRRARSCLLSCAVFALTLGPGLALAADDEDSSDSNAGSRLAITSATWDSGDRELRVRGTGNRGLRVTVSNAFDASQRLDETRRVEDRGTWRIKDERPSPVPCRVLARQSDGQEAELDVANAPSNCAPSGGDQPPPNVGPGANANGPYTGTTGVVVSFSSAGSNDSDGNIAAYAWAFGDGGTSTQANPSHAYQSAANYTVTLTVTDNDGATASDSTTANINDPANVSPTANANGPYSETTGVAVSFSSSGSNDSDGNIASYAWAFGDGGTSTQANPSHAYQSAGNYTVTLTVTDNDGATASDSTTANINDPANVSPTANANGPYSETTGVAVSFSSAGSNDSDGSINSYAWDFGDGNTSTAANPSHTYQAAGTYDVTLTVTDNDGATGTDTTTATVTDGEEVACVPTPGNGPQTHADCITVYTGPQVCVACHEGEAREMHGSVHYQQGGEFLNTTIPLDFAAAGERPAHAADKIVATGVNTYCGTHENSPRFTCAGCHVGNGRFPMAESEFLGLNDEQQELEQLANIDCLTCHQDAYKRFPDPSGQFKSLFLENVDLVGGILVEAPGSSVERTGLEGIPVVDPVTLDFQFVPADPFNAALAGLPAGLMDVSAVEAAQTVHPTTSKSCLSCHAGAGGGDGTKRGDLSKDLNEDQNPSTTQDFHMSAQGANHTCSTCHDAGGHRVSGRGLDLRPNDVAGPLNCTSTCHDPNADPQNQPIPHTDAPHSNSTLNRHTAKVACQTCHIPTYAKGGRDANGNLVGTEVARDWLAPEVSQTACNGRGGWLPNEIKASNLVPTYTWFDGVSAVSYLGEDVNQLPTKTVPNDPLLAGFAAGSQGYVIAAPDVIVNGAGALDHTFGASVSGAKIYPMKEHWGKLARNEDTTPKTLVGHSTFEFFRTGDFDAAVRSGMEQTPGMTANDAYTVVPVHTYQTINHGVEQKANALGASGTCGTCHTTESGGPRRMDLKAMGYELTRAGITISSSGTPSCTLSCHGKSHSRESGSLSRIHSRGDHMADGCVGCHGQLTGR